MARFQFGGTLASWVVSSVDAADLGEGVKAVVLPKEPIVLEVYNAPGGTGALVTDFLDAQGSAVTAIALAARDPYIPRFSGPDTVRSLWVQAHTGEWLPIPRYDDGSGAGGGGAGDVVLAGGNVQEYANSQSPPWLAVKRPNDATNSDGWSNLLELHYWDNATGQYRLAFYANEKGLLRTRGATPVDVPARIMAHPQHSGSTAVFEVTLDDNTVKVLQAFTTQVVLSVPVVVPYVVNPLGERLYWGTADPATDPAYANHRPNLGAAWIDYNNPPA